MNPIIQTNQIIKKTQSLSSNLSNLNLQQSIKRPQRTEYTEVTIEHYNSTKNNETQRRLEAPKIVVYKPVDVNSIYNTPPQQQKQQVKKLKDPTYVNYTYYFRDHIVTPKVYKYASKAVKHHDNRTLNYLDKIYTINKK